MSEQQPPKKSKRTRNSRPRTTSTQPEPVIGELVTKEGSLKKRVGTLTYTTDKGEAIIESVKEGMPVKMAAQFHRIPYRTVLDWMKWGEEGRDPFEAFAIEVRQAQATFVQEMIAGIKAAGLDSAKQWTALMTLLERLYPEDFRRPTERTENLHLHGFVDGRIQELVGSGAVEYDGG